MRNMPHISAVVDRNVWQAMCTEVVVKKAFETRGLVENEGFMKKRAQLWRLEKLGNPGSIRNKLLILSAAGIVPTICVALLGFYTISRLNQRTGVVVAATSSLRNHWEGDMMHDDLRGDVLGALLAKTDQERAKRRAGLAADATRFRNALRRNRAIPSLDPEVRAALDGLYPSLEAYIEDAEGLADLAERDRTSALNRLAQFEDTFDALDHRQELVSELVMRKEASAE